MNTSLIINNNTYHQNIPKSTKPTALIIRAAKDKNQAFSSDHDWIRWPIQTVHKTHQTAIRVLSKPAFLKAGKETCERFNTKQIDFMFVQAHGKNGRIILSSESIYSPNAVNAADFECMAPHGTVILQSCESRALAYQIAQKTNLIVYGFDGTGFADRNLLIPSEVPDKYDFIGWDEQGNRNTVRFKAFEGVVQEENHYGPTSQQIIDFCMQEALQGRASAMHLLGEFFFHGLEAPQSLEQALHWYKAAALANHSGGIHGIAKIIHLGNHAIAIPAIRELGLIFDNPQLAKWYNEDKAMKLLKLAADKGDKGAAQILMDKELEKIKSHIDDHHIEYELDLLALELELEHEKIKNH